MYISFEALSKNCGDLCLVRVGRKSHIHPAVAKYSLDVMTKELLDKASSSATGENLISIKDRLKNYDTKESEMDREIWQLENSPHPGNQDKVSLF